jgi:hypothetical protein
MAFLNPLKRFGVPGLVGFDEFLGLFLELLKIGPRGKRF